MGKRRLAVIGDFFVYIRDLLVKWMNEDYDLSLNMIFQEENGFN